MAIDIYWKYDTNHQAKSRCNAVILAAHRGIIGIINPLASKFKIVKEHYKLIGYPPADSKIIITNNLLRCQ